MYVCICKGVTENQIRDAVRAGACTRKELARCLKVGTACGKCNPQVRELLPNRMPAGRSRIMPNLHEGVPARHATPPTGRCSHPGSSPGGDRARTLPLLASAACSA